MPFLLCFTLYLRASFQLQSSGGLIFGRATDLTEGFLHYLFGGLILFWRGLYMDGLIFGILRYTSCGGLFCGYLQLSQEKLKTLMLIQNFGGQRRYITGDVQVADL